MSGNSESPVRAHKRSVPSRNWQWPLSGAVVVMRQRLRPAVRRDLTGAALLLFVLLGVSGLLETQPPMANGSEASPPPFWQDTAFYLHSVHAFCLRWLLMFVFAASFALMPLAGVMGARAVPRASEKEAVQAALLTRLRAGDICLGRLLAALWPVAALLGLSCAGWMCLQIGTRFVPETWSGIRQIAERPSGVAVRRMAGGQRWGLCLPRACVRARCGDGAQALR